jgi:hypothetical protein
MRHPSPRARLRVLLLLAVVGLSPAAGCGNDDERRTPADLMRIHTSVLERQKQLIEGAYAAIAPDALAHKRAFRDQVVRYMRDTYGLEVGAGAATATAPAADVDAGSFLIFAARSDALPRGYYDPGVSQYQQFAFDDLAAAQAFMAERLALSENLFVRAVPASAAEIGETLVFAEYPDIAMTVFHEALHNRIQLPLAVEEPLHTLLAVALTERFGATLPGTTDAERRLKGWVEEGARELGQRFARSASRYQTWYAMLDPASPDPTLINQYALDMLAAYRASDGSDAQERHGLPDAPPYLAPSLMRDLRIVSLGLAEQGLIGTAFLADYSTYERRFAAVHELMAPFLAPDRIDTALAALLDHTVPDEERWSFDQAVEERALTWLADTLATIGPQEPGADPASNPRRF